MSAQTEYAELYRTALTWTKGDADRARAMVETYFRGRYTAESATTREP